MRLGVAIDLHATATSAGEVSWSNVREQVLTAESLGLDLVVLPDHLSYRAGGDGDYALPDEAVGVREAVTEAAALAAVTSQITVAHSVINAPYRTPAMLAHVAATLADISRGRYLLGIGVGNSFDYDQVGVAADHRVARFEECVEIVARLLRDGDVHVDGTHWSAADAELVLAPDVHRRPPIVVAAGGPRTMRVAARFGDAWNGFVPTDPAATVPTDLLGLLDQTCEEVGRDPSTIARTVDIGVDSLDVRGARGRSVEMLGKLGELAIDEARCYVPCDPTHASRIEAIEALAELAGSI
jgi:alkanesulfonate monooxygenase SsuD/methylene tetrahydromethanopterin reductase-like flavin-dependent oxidoreductase (luciferase family)